jgi:hypothetical protein
MTSGRSQHIAGMRKNTIDLLKGRVGTAKLSSGYQNARSEVFLAMSRRQQNVGPNERGAA